MQNLQILLDGPMFSANVYGIGLAKEVSIKPHVVINTATDEMGILLEVFAGNEFEKPVKTIFWSRQDEHDIITLWRAMYILKHFRMVTSDDVQNAYFASKRKRALEEEKFALLAKYEIGDIAYDQVMSMIIPTPLAGFFLGIAEGDPKVPRESFTEELEAGTLEWFDEFARLDIERPKGGKDD